MMNNAIDVTPAIYTAPDTNTAFAFWGGSAILEDYSTYGAQVYHAAGHEVALGMPNIQMTLISDFTSLKWSVANVPVAPNPNTTFSSVDGRAPDGTPYNPHTYLGLQEMPAAWGGSSKGTLVQMLFAGINYTQKINLLDVTQATHGYTQMVTRQPQNAAPSEVRFSANGMGNNYPISVMDKKRQGWWLATNGTVDYTLFISKDGTITQLPALGGNLQDGSLVLADSLNLLVAIDGGYATGPYASTSYRKLYIRNLTTGVVTTTTTQGPVPELAEGYDGSSTPCYHRPGTLGLQWVETLGAAVGLDDTTSPPQVVMLKPPATDPATQPWTWSTVPIQHWDQGDPNGSPTLRALQNGTWSKFRWVESLQAFVYCASSTHKPQIITL
jgi:hypothetical protein